MARASQDLEGLYVLVQDGEVPVCNAVSLTLEEATRKAQACADETGRECAVIIVARSWAVARLQPSRPKRQANFAEN